MDTNTRLAELLGALSLASDIADGYDAEKSLRTTIAAMRLKELTGGAVGSRDVFYAATLRFSGCTAYAHEETRFAVAGDDIELRRALSRVDFGRPVRAVGVMTRGFASEQPLRERVRAIARLALSASAHVDHAAAQCEAGVHFARSLGLSSEVVEALNSREERFDGRGPRRGLSGDSLSLVARVCDVADILEMFAWSGGLGTARRELQARRGGQLDPDIVDAAIDALEHIAGSFSIPSVWEAYLACEPEPHLVLTPGSEGAVFTAFGRFADLKSAFTLGHSEHVARLMRQGADALGLDAATQRACFHAGLVHDIGRVGLPNALWNKPGPFTPFERERASLHATFTESVLRACPALERLCDIAGAAHERGGRGGYPRRSSLEELSLPARMMGVADMFAALTEPRPHREALDVASARRRIEESARSGALDARACAAVLGGSCVTAESREPPPCGLTERELEVARLVALGRTNADIGRLLGISPRTAQKHVMHIYDKTGRESRAGLALFIAEHGLLGAMTAS